MTGNSAKQIARAWMTTEKYTIDQRSLSSLRTQTSKPTSLVYQLDISCCDAIMVGDPFGLAVLSISLLFPQMPDSLQYSKQAFLIF